MEKTYAFFAPCIRMPYDRMIMFASCIALTVQGVWELVVYILGINLNIASGGYALFFILDMNVAFYSPIGWLLLALLVAKVAVYSFGSYFAFTRWDDSASMRIFILAASVYVLVSILLMGWMFLVSHMWAHLTFFNASKAYYGAFKGLHILSVVVGCSIPLVALLPRMKELHIVAHARQSMSKARSEIMHNTALIHEKMRNHMTTINVPQAGTNHAAPTTAFSTEPPMTSFAEQPSTSTPPLSSHEQVKVGHGTIGDDLFAAFIGKNIEYYMQKFSMFGYLGGNFALSWNWAGFFFPQLWFLYRKMYLFGIIFLLVSICFPFIGWLLSGIVVGAWGNHAYYTHTTKKLLLLLASPVPQENRLAAVVQLGGVNLTVVLVIVGAAALSVIVFGSFVSAFFR